ncbi:MAG: DNA-formamidopyrimidine glycosylase [Patescibacteria group bacterium]|nr:DNA-formamidopyrimidine glycosylase [Patescibacteria group bacterium]
MPELPEVQTTASGLDARIRGLRIESVWTDYRSPLQRGKESIKDPAYFRRFKEAVIGRRIASVGRKAKNVLIRLDSGDTILVHMKMTGHLMYGDYDRSDPFNRFIHLVIGFDNGATLELSDMRKFAKVALIKEADLETSPHLERIGPDPLGRGFSLAAFKERLALKPRMRIKQALMDQALIAGIGNIYSDEALWRAGINPEERVSGIPGALMKRLFAATLEVLNEGIDFGGDSMSDYRDVDGKPGRFQDRHRAYRKTGEPCSKRGCRGIIVRAKVGGRSAHFCSSHQKLLRQAA